MTKSWTAPATTTPTIIQMVPGKYPICLLKSVLKGPAPAIAQSDVQTIPTYLLEHSLSHRLMYGLVFADYHLN